MPYNPKIYIRDYVVTDERLIAFSGEYTLVGSDAGLKRHVVLHAENDISGEEFVMFSGDEQSGSDVLLLSGGDATDRLVITHSTAYRLAGYDAFLIAVNTDMLLLSGDAQSGTDAVSLSGDEQSGTDTLLVSTSA